MSDYWLTIMTILRLLGRDLVTYKLVVDENGDTIEVREPAKLKILDLE